MGYIGATPSNAFINNDVQRVTNSTNNYVDLDHNISSLDSVIVFVNNVRQESTNLTFTSASRITLGDTLTTSDVVEIVFIGKAVATQSAAANSITNEMLSGSIANSKLANSSITLNGSAVSLGGSATVTPSVTPDNLQVFAKSANQTISANSATIITSYGDGQIADRLLFNYGTQYVTHSSGVFSFSTEGYYHVVLRVSGTQTASGGTATGHVYLNNTTNNTTYADAIDINLSVATATGGFNSYYDGVFKITDTSNHKLNSQIYLPQGGEVAGGGGTRRRTFIAFARLGTTT
jgi:hypothetical protein